MVDIHQSPQYAHYMKRLGWIIETVDGVNAFIKKFPFVGSVIKIQRPNHIPKISSLKKLKRKYRAWSVVIEPSLRIKNREYGIENLKKTNTYYLPTKTIYIDLKQSEEKLWKSFSSSTRRAIRRAKKNNITIKESTKINAFISLKKKQFFPLGFLFTRDIMPLWETMYSKNATILFAYSRHAELVSASQESQGSRNKFGMTKNEPIAGIFLLFYKQTSYYWLAVSTNKGNSIAAPSILAWEAMKLAKKKKCVIFDFEGIYDERFPNRNKNWHGFTRFKRGFGGKEILFPDQNLSI